MSRAANASNKGLSDFGALTLKKLPERNISLRQILCRVNYAFQEASCRNGCSLFHRNEIQLAQEGDALLNLRVGQSGAALAG